MSTKKLYYTDPYTVEFSGYEFTITEIGNKPAVVFPETYFYPTSGGQEHDNGSINDCYVVDVIESNGIIYHVLDKPLAGNSFTATIDWDRRFQNMQQHTGQHLLSRAIEDLYNLDTVSSRLGESGNTIDLNLTQFTEEMIHATEKYVNDIIWKHKSVKIHFADDKQIDQFPLRSKPKITGIVRIIEVEGYDFNACGGTHCTNTGEIGLIKITGVEKIKGNLIRLNFLCGSKALQDFQMRVSVMNNLTTKISANGLDIIGQVDRLISENKNYQKKISVLNQYVLDREAERLLSEISDNRESFVISATYSDFSPDDIRYLAAKLASHSNLIILLSSKADRLNFCFSRSAAIDLDFKQLLPDLLSMTNGKGGGKSEFIQFSCDNNVQPETVFGFIRSKI